MSDCESSTEETISAIIKQCETKPVKLKRRKRQKMSAEELEILRKTDNERKRRRRRAMSEEELKVFLIREKERKSQRRKEADYDETRAKEAAYKRNRRKEMELNKLETFRARDAERKRLAREKVKLNKQATSLPKSHSQKETEKSTNPKRGRGRKRKYSEKEEKEEAEILIISDVDTGDSCEFGQVIDCDETADRVKELEAVLNDLLEEKHEAGISVKNQEVACENSTEDRATQLEDQIWQLIDEQEKSAEQSDVAIVENDQVMTLSESSEEFSHLEHRILKIIHSHYNEIEELIDELNS